MIKLLVLALLAAIVSGCAAVLPDTVDVHAEHISHVTQHAPFTDAPTRYGANYIGIGARWGKRTGPYLELNENINVDSCQRLSGGERMCGGLLGGRETFEGRVGYVFQLK